MIEMKIWVNKVKETTKTLEYKNSGNINIDIKYISNLSSNIREAWYKLGVKQLQPIYEDLYLLSLVIFAVDKRVPRSVFPDAWTRRIQISIPVIELDAWSSVKDDVDKMLSYLSGDEWNVNFRACESDSKYKSQRKREAHRPDYLNSIEAVSLFSGGLDSFCGAYKLLSGNKPTLFVGYQEYGPLKGLQKELIESIHNEYPECFCDLLSFTAVARSLILPNDERLESENTSRSRSFLFLCAAITIAGIVGDGIPVYIPENGFIGLNLPMTPGRLGSCSTRTTHPYFLRLFNSILSKIGINHRIENPYAYSTKREMVSQFKDTQSFSQNFHKTISCSHPCNGRWDGYPVPQNCGYCYPCLIRRSSLLDLDLSIESYGKDILNPNITANLTKAKLSDLEDLISSIITANESTDSELRRRIAQTGKLSLEEIELFLRLYKSTICDLKQLFKRNAVYSRLIGE